MQSDVDGGRKILNFSEWDRAQPALAELVDVIARGQMPPLQVPRAPQPREGAAVGRREGRLIAGLRRLYATDPPAAIKRIGTHAAVRRR